MLNDLQASRNSREVQLVAKYLDLVYEDLKEQLVDAAPDALAIVQARAQQTLYLKTKITQPSMAEMQAQYTTKE